MLVQLRLATASRTRVSQELRDAGSSLVERLASNRTFLSGPPAKTGGLFSCYRGKRVSGGQTGRLHSSCTHRLGECLVARAQPRKFTIDPWTLSAPALM